MDQLNVLSGSEIVARGHQKVNVTLPELGLKDIFRSGSWIEQKQVQAALEARKDIIEVERIEKSGILSQAVWREDLSLAEVISKTGGHWQFFGHNKGINLYLYPEEALFLIELNCLQLKYHGLTVSLQQAYALMFKSADSLLRYKVFASLSRLGYKVYRHTEPLCRIAGKRKYEEKTENSTFDMANESESDRKRPKKNDISDSISNNEDVTVTIESDNVISENCPKTETFNNSDDHHVQNNENNTGQANQENCCEVTKSNDVNKSHPSNNNEVMSISDSSEIDILKTNGTVPSGTQISKQNMIVHNYRLKKLKNRKQLPSSLTNKVFESIPDLSHKQTVTIKAPKAECIPQNINLNLTDYVVNLDYLHSANRSRHTSSRIYSMSDEANGPHMRRIKNTSHAETSSTSTPPLPPTNVRYRPQTQYRPFQFWRPRPQFSFFQYQFLFQRPFGPRFQYNPTVPPLISMRCPNQPHINQNSRPNVSHHRKRTRDSSKHYHMDAIKRLVIRLKQLVQNGMRHEQNLQALQSLVNTYNVRYKSRIRISSELDIVDDSVVDTIELDDDEASPSTKSHLEPNFEHFTENLNKLKQLALRVKEYESKNSVNTSRHRRSLINAIRTFNKSYNAEVILNTNFEVLDRRHITLASSSDSDCVIEEVPAPKSGKKLRNPFNILKQLSEKRNSIILSQIDTKTINNNCNVAVNLDTEHYVSEVSTTFEKWLPPSTDFGRAEVPHIDYKDEIIDNIQGEHLLDYMASHRDQYEKWVDLKISFIENINLNSTMVQSQAPILNNGGLGPIIKPEDCTDMQRVLKKLSIIKNRSDIGENSLKIDYDVYHRDVKNFRKSDRPPPHFMLVCIEESSSLPPAADISALKARYTENDQIVFAIVGIGSIQYLQINPMELAIYIPNSELS